MKNQRKRFPLWGLKGLLSVALTGFGIAAFAQAAEVCKGAGYTIANAVEASAGSEYRWLENGSVLANTDQATYTVPSNKAAGVYTYIRQSKSAGCPDWQSSNEFTVTVFDCAFAPPSTVTGTTATFTDPRDGKHYKTVVMPDGRIWFAQNLNYTKDLTFNRYAREANGKQFTSTDNGIPAIGSYWCPNVSGSTYSGDQNTCNIFGALYTWETAMMVDGKYADESKTNSAWDELWVSGNYYSSGAPGTEPNADKNNARGGTYTKSGGRGICPKGWHVPTIKEWAIMLDKVDGNGSGDVFKTTVPFTTTPVIIDAGVKLMSENTTNNPDASGGWQAPAKAGTDVYGFAILPSGYRDQAGSRFWPMPAEGYAHGAAICTHRTTLSTRLIQSNVLKLQVLDRSIGSPVRCLNDTL
jgi:uncharacterized protein (TIGR02145 family)